MSKQYEEYLKNHKANVRRGFEYIRDNLSELLKPDIDYEWQCCYGHDLSKDDPQEYEAYDAYFYGGNRSFKVVNDFRLAWLRHIHNNPHHWQYWILHNDDPGESMIVLEMPHNYIIEMICDWWAFSWSKGDLTEIFDWYDAHKDYMKLESKTRETVEDILDKIKEHLEKEKEND